ncbi:DUF1931 family protein [Hydrogenothermus marinus]|uniref:Uncharacterized protein DUF1931 n=1 Tax=Hydrogenothermus marinus TaxID=133270 RepID=A0A3M0BSY1_9AQUI|nr:DUF1931 family protein [Hydrogenothermus marinus]RMA97615.1 uncharacterized protein DUF1931 [Hydrogenothermus marinus]
MAITGVHKIEEIFKKSASLRLDKDKIKEVNDLISQKLYDLLIVAEENAGYNARDVIWLSDVPLTKAMKESMRKFKELEEELELQPILDHLATLPPLKYELEVELEKKLPEIAGTLIYILAMILKEISQDRKVSAEDLEKAKTIYNLTI